MLHDQMLTVLYDQMLCRQKKCYFNTMTSVHKPDVFITGGQTGADSIPLECYRELDISVDGYMPKGFSRTDGRGEEIAREHGLKEFSEDSYRLKDIANAEQSDALIAFLVTPSDPTKPTGRGTMQTVSQFVRGYYRKPDKSYVHIDRPECRYIAYIPDHPDEQFRSLKPVLVLWDISPENIHSTVITVRPFLNLTKPKRLMFSGPTEDTAPDLLKNGVALMRTLYSSE